MIFAAPILLGLLTAPAHAAEPQPLMTGERVYVETSVQLPRFMWFLADFNRDVRVSGFDVELVMTCATSVPGKRTSEVQCKVDDAALRASPMTADRRNAQAVFEQMRDKLAGSTLVLAVRRDGRITNVGLRDAYTLDLRHRRIRQMNENLRLVAARAIAGLDLQRPKGALEDGAMWAQRQTMLTMAPSASGTLGSTELIYRAAPGPEGRLSVRGEGRAMIAPASGMRAGGPADTFDTRLVSEAYLDPETGRIDSVAWTVIGVPTASSAIAEGFAGIPYVQKGRAVALRPGEIPELGPTGPIEPKGQQPSALQQDVSLGVAR